MMNSLGSFFSNSVDCLLIWVIVSFSVQNEPFKFVEILLVHYCYYFLSNHSPIQNEIVLSVTLFSSVFCIFSCNNLKISGLILIPVVHFELTFVQISCVLSVFYLETWYPLFSTPFSKEAVFSPISKVYFDKNLMTITRRADFWVSYSIPSFYVSVLFQ
jgi:hypothetical protein